MDDLSGANYRSSMRFQPIHPQNEVDVRRLQDNGRGIEFQPFDFHGDIDANQGGLTLSHGVLTSTEVFISSHLTSCLYAKSSDMNECDAPESNKTDAGTEFTRSVPMTVAGWS